MHWWQLLLYPFSILFDLITRFRNKLYDLGISKTIQFDANVVVVGNLAIGGTGKTPMIDYLINYFHQKELKVSTLSRGYGRKTTGFRLATQKDTPDSIGDEPYMYLDKYQGQVPVAVCAIRDLAISELLGHEPETHAILMDDAMQHRRVMPSVTIMLTTFSRLFCVDHVLPSGWLRESRWGADRAQIIIVTKCPMFLSESDQVKISYEISTYSKAQVFFATVEYLPLKPIFNDSNTINRKVIGISGMANPAPFETYLKENYEVKLTYNYRDHYRYQAEDIRHIIRELDQDTSLITTEKDMVKLKQFEDLKVFSCYYLPIRMKFLKDESLFLSKLESYLVDHQ